MLSPTRIRPDNGAWRRNPLVGFAAAAVTLLALLTFSCRSCRASREPTRLPPGVTKQQAERIARYCPHCKKVFFLSRKQLESMPGDEPLLIKARNAPCPTCSTTGTTEPQQCVNCGGYFGRPAPAEGTPAPPVCPHCKKNPYRPAKP